MTRSGKQVLLALGAAAFAMVALYAGILRYYGLTAQPRLSPAEQTRAIAQLRARLLGARSTAPSPLKVRTNGPVWATIYHAGDILVRRRSDKRNLQEAIEDLGGELRRDPALADISPATLAAARLKVDVVTGLAPIITSVPAAFALSVAPGLDGVGVRVDGRAAYLLPDDLFRNGWLAAAKPFFFMHEFRTGLDARAAVTALADQLGLTVQAWRKGARRFFRFRVQSFVETGVQGAVRGVVRLRVPVQRVTRAMGRRAAVRAADYVLRQLRANGRFHYLYYPLEDKHSPGHQYNLPRHAGTTWFLAMAYRELGLPRFRSAARKAIEYLVGQRFPPPVGEATSPAWAATTAQPWAQPH